MGIWAANIGPIYLEDKTEANRGISLHFLQSYSDFAFFQIVKYWPICASWWLPTPSAHSHCARLTCSVSKEHLNLEIQTSVFPLDTHPQYQNEHQDWSVPLVFPLHPWQLWACTMTGNDLPQYQRLDLMYSTISWCTNMFDSWQSGCWMDYHEHLQHQRFSFCCNLSQNMESNWRQCSVKPF